MTAVTAIWRALLAEADDQALDELAQLLAPRLRHLADATPAEILLTPEEAAARCSLSRQTIYRALRSGHLPASKPDGTSWRIAPSELEAWAAAGAVASATTEPAARRPGRRRERPSGEAAVAAIAGGV